MRGWMTLGAAVLCLAATPVAARAPDPSAEAEVRASLHGLADGFSSNDAEKVIGYLSRDMHLIHPLRGEVGYDDFAGGIRAASARPDPTRKRVAIELDHLYLSGDLAVTGITWRTTITAPDGKVTLRGERDQEVWRREPDGKWRLFRGASFPLKLEQPGS